MLRRLGELKKTVIVSSHILPELADVCSRVGMIEKGHLLVDGDVREVMRKARESVSLQVRVKEDGPGNTARTDAAAALLEQHDEVRTVEVAPDGTITAVLKPGVEDYTAIPQNLLEAGFAPTLFREEEVNLETAFMELTKGASSESVRPGRVR